MVADRVSGEGTADAGQTFAPLGGAAADRLVSLDFIRGIAVLGILAANIAGYALSSMESGWPSIFGPLDAGSIAVWLFDLVFVDGKMRSLFAILFGAGLALFIDRVEAKGGVGVALQVRRLGWLLAFGIAHFYLLFRGDILAAYAFWGFFAMMMTRLPPALLLSLGATLYLAMVPLDMASYGAALEPPVLAASGEEGNASPFAGRAYDYADLREQALTDRSRMRDGSLAQIVAHKQAAHAYRYLAGSIDALFDSFPMMLIGIALYRLGLFARGAGSGRLKLWGWGLAAVGIATALALARVPLAQGLSIETIGYYTHALMPLQRLPMTLAWLFLLLAYLPRLAYGKVGQRIIAAGRMAFSNYIGTSLLMALIFQGWGLGLFGSFTRLELAGFVLLGWAAMLAWSKPWLERHAQGPLEWLWRCLTYWRLFPFRR